MPECDIINVRRTPVSKQLYLRIRPKASLSCKIVAFTLFAVRMLLKQAVTKLTRYLLEHLGHLKFNHTLGSLLLEAKSLNAVKLMANYLKIRKKCCCHLQK
jgi:hypothetical protein